MEAGMVQPGSEAKSYGASSHGSSSTSAERTAGNGTSCNGGDENLGGRRAFSDSSGEEDSDLDSEDDEWRPSGRRRPRKPVNVQRSQATRLMWKRRRAARRRASAARLELASLPGPPSVPAAPARAAADADRRFPLCWSDTTLGSSVGGRPREVCNGPPIVGDTLAEGPSPAVEVSAGRSDTWEGSEGRADAPRERPRSGPHRACRPKLFQRDDSRSDDDSLAAVSCERDEERPGARPGSGWDGNSVEARSRGGRNSRPRLLQKRHMEDVEDYKFGLSEESPYAAEKCAAAAEPPRPRMPARTPPRPRMLSRGNYVAEDGADCHRGSEGASELVRCSRKKKLSLAAKQRWERRRAKNGFLGGGGPEASAMPKNDPPTPPLREMTALRDSASDRGKAGFTLPAKLRWKWNGGSLDYFGGASAADVPPKAREIWQASTDEKADFSMPAKLRWKQDRGLASEENSSSSSSNGAREAHCAGPPAIVTAPPGSSPPEGAQGSETEAPAAQASREDKVNRRSHAKKLWWQRMKTFTLDGNPGSGAPLAEPIPKFLQAELFPNIRAKRRPKRAAPTTESAGDRGAGEPAKASRRSLAMKENWRKRKQAWIQAAAKSVAALVTQPANLADQLAGMSIVEFGSATQLARTVFLAQCRTAQQAALLSEMALLESTARFECPVHVRPTNGVSAQL